MLQTADAYALLGLSSTNRRHAMCALADLSKFLGCYNHWKDIRERYDLKWTNNNDLDIFNTIMSSKNNYSSMFAWLKETCSNNLLEPHANIILYTTMTELRIGKAFYSLHLLHIPRLTITSTERG